MNKELISVLHVDDYPPLHDLLKHNLKKQDERFTIHSEASAEAGAEYLRKNTVDCIVSDYSMPGMDGLAFLEAVRAEYPDLPFIFYMRKGAATIATKALDAGADDYLEKQLDTTQYDLLANKITTLVEKHRAEGRLAHLEQQQHVADGGIYSKEEVEFKHAEASMSMAVVQAVADRENTDPVSLPPLNDAIDPDAVDALFPATNDAYPRAESLTFTYHGYSVTISNAGQITLNE